MKFATADAINQLNDINPNLECLTEQQINAINNENRKENHPRNCAEGNAPNPYFSSTPITLGDALIGKPKMLISPRNNNFSNRDTKLYIWTQPRNSESTGPDSTPSDDGPIILDYFSKNESAPQYNKTTGSYENDDKIQEGIDQDTIPFEPVENDSPPNYDGGMEGCSSDLKLFSSARSSLTSPFLLIGAFLCVLQDRVRRHRGQDRVQQHREKLRGQQHRG